VLPEELMARVQARIQLLQTQKQLAQRNLQFTTILESIGQGSRRSRRPRLTEPRKY
jgi:diguanylate cyclase